VKLGKTCRFVGPYLYKNRFVGLYLFCLDGSNITHVYVIKKSCVFLDIADDFK
jgi:hypothetical protein